MVASITKMTKRSLEEYYDMRGRLWRGFFIFGTVCTALALTLPYWQILMIPITFAGYWNYSLIRRVNRQIFNLEHLPAITEDLMETDIVYRDGVQIFKNGTLVAICTNEDEAEQMINNLAELVALKARSNNLPMEMFNAARAEPGAQ